MLPLINRDTCNMPHVDMFSRCISMPNASELIHNLDDVALHHDMLYCGDKWVCTLKVHASLI